jgi:hypothetical protein
MVYGLSFPEQRRSHTNLRGPAPRSAAHAERQQKATIVAPILFAIGGAFVGTAARRKDQLIRRVATNTVPPHFSPVWFSFRPRWYSDIRFSTLIRLFCPSLPPRG